MKRMLIERASAWALVIATAFATSASTPPVFAQARRDSSAFVELRSDGNGIPELQSTIASAFSGKASGALISITFNANLNLTYEPTLHGLGNTISIPAHDRTAAVALLEVASAAHLRMRISARGQIVVEDESSTNGPATMARRTATSRDTSSRLPTELEGLRVTAPRPEQELFQTTAIPSGYTFTAEALRSTPMFLEPDIVRSVQTLPGIQARSDWAAGFNVHGGESDQTLVRLDGYPIYNPFHLAGIFSTFIDDAVGEVQLYTGALPARYSERLSGVLDVRSKKPSSTNIKGTLSVSLLSTSATLGKQFSDNKGSWFIAARRTYADVFVNLLKPNALPYHFQDLQGQLNRQIFGGIRLAITGYTGSDEGGANNNKTPASEWGNGVVGATLSKHFGQSFRLRRLLQFDSADVEQRVSRTMFHAGFRNGAFVAARNQVADTRIGGTLSLHHATAATAIGYEFSAQRLSYIASTPFEDFGDIIPYDSLQQQLHAVSLFVDHQWKPTDEMIVDIGGRYEHADHVTGLGFSPRFSIKYFASPTLAINIGGGRYTQSQHSLGREEEPLRPLQFWVLSDGERTASHAYDVVMGFENWLMPNRLLHVAAFYKLYDHLLASNPFSDPNVPGDAFQTNKGESRGIDFMLRQLEGGRFSGWMSYSFALNTRIDADGVHYWPTQDVRHTLNAVGSWRKDRHSYGVRVALATGAPYTPSVGNFEREHFNPIAHSWRDTPYYELESVAGDRNSQRLPFYHRVDLSATIYGHAFGKSVTTYLSVVNALNSHNPAGYLYSYESNGTRSSFPNLPFVPTVGVSIGH